MPYVILEDWRRIAGILKRCILKCFIPIVASTMQCASIADIIKFQSLPLEGIFPEDGQKAWTKNKNISIIWMVTNHIL
jgi:hypothetical protein